MLYGAAMLYGAGHCFMHYGAGRYGTNLMLYGAGFGHCFG